MKYRPFPEDIINNYDWIVGGQNFDEDLHFSSFYLRQSTNKLLGKETSSVYHTIIGIYKDFNEI